MAYAILRTAKLRTVGSIKASAEHTFRERETPNADASKTPTNQHFGAHSADEVLEAIEARLATVKVRKNAVRAIEYLFTASPEWFNGPPPRSPAEVQEYFRRSTAWLHARHGRENVVYVGAHHDEKTPHMVAYVVPIDDRGRLCARTYLGGRETLGRMQSEFACKVADLGLERGVEGSKATHTRVAQFWGSVERAEREDPSSTRDDERAVNVALRGRNRELEIERKLHRSERDELALRAALAQVDAQRARRAHTLRLDPVVAKSARRWPDALLSRLAGAAAEADVAVITGNPALDKRLVDLGGDHGISR